jgi:membrane-associated protein
VNFLSSLQVDSPLSYLIAILLPALDAILPLLPSETAVIALGVSTAGSADPRIALLVAAAAAGAFLGDNLAYLLGRRFGPWAERRFFSTQKGQASRAWAQRSLARFGVQLIIVCRFIPAGRTAVTLTCGLTGYPRRKFVAGTAVAAVIWALYAFFIGRLGGKAFEEKPWVGFLVAFGGTIVISGLIEGIRRIRAWARRRGQARPSGSHAGQVETDDPGEHQADGHQFRDGYRVAEHDHPDRRRSDGADTGPDRVGGPDLEVTQGDRQQAEADQR